MAPCCPWRTPSPGRSATRSMPLLAVRCASWGSCCCRCGTNSSSCPARASRACAASRATGRPSASVNDSSPPEPGPWSPPPIRRARPGTSPPVDGRTWRSSPASGQRRATDSRWRRATSPMPPTTSRGSPCWPPAARRHRCRPAGCWRRVARRRARRSSRSRPGTGRATSTARSWRSPSVASTSAASSHAPSGAGAWRYRFLLQVSGDAAADPLADALTTLQLHTVALRILGSFDVATGDH